MQEVWRDTLPFLDNLTAVQTLRELKFGLYIIFQRVGVEKCALTLTPRRNQALDDVLLVNSFPYAWERHYANRRYLMIDPAHRVAQKVTHIFTWKQAFEKQLTANQKKLYDDVRDARLENTIVIPLRSTVFTGLGWLEGRDLQHDQFPICGLILNWALDKAAQLKGVPAPPALLSPRQRDVFCWIAEGKTTSEVAEILKLSIKTVDTHIAQAMKKLDASTRTQALAIAMRHKIIS
jgi:LuxR family quorum sensing-dependent transcriptional regulator